VDCLTDTNYTSKRQLQRNALRIRHGAECRHVGLRLCARMPCYVPQYDLSVINSEGKHVASCVGYADFEHHIAEIEKSAPIPSTAVKDWVRR